MNTVYGGIIGIDAGGTFTDMVFMSEKDKKVLTSLKIPTFHGNMLKTISDGITKMLDMIDPKSVMAVNIATTHATNAIVENKIHPAALILIGYDRAQAAKAVANGASGAEKVFCIGGGHDVKGNEAAPLDVEAVRRVINEDLGNVESVAVSGFFSVRNPAHENAVSEMIHSVFPDKYVTCGHELASDLDAILRAATAFINAGLIPIVIQLLDSVDNLLRSAGISAPIFIVRSDGSLVSREWAETHPIETILSGPAASAVGARFLSCGIVGRRPSWIVDIGGTTTDIIYLDAEGEPVMSEEGAEVGGRRTLIKTIDTYTFGLGGDSRVYLDRENNITVGPKRVRPLCALIKEKPHYMEIFERPLSEPLIAQEAGIITGTDAFEEKIIKNIRKGIAAADDLIYGERLSNVARARLADMETKGTVTFAGFTPTDALHVLDKFNRWDKKASEAAAGVLAKANDSAVEFSNRVCAEVVRKIALNVVKKSLAQSYGDISAEEERLIDWSLKQERDDAISFPIKLNAALIGVGAPSWAFIEDVGKLLGENAVLPENAGVAGAIGAAVGSFSLKHSIWITVMKDGAYRAHMPMGIRDYQELEDAVEETRKYMIPWLRELAYNAGAKAPVVTFRRNDEIFSSYGRKVHLWTRLLFEAEEGELPVE